MKRYVGVAVVEVTVYLDMTWLPEGGLIEPNMVEKLELCDYGPQGTLEWEVVDVVGPSGWPTIELRGSTEDVEAFLDATNFTVDV